MSQINNNKLSISNTLVTSSLLTDSYSKQYSSSPAFKNTLLIEQDDENLKLNISEIKSSLYEYELFAMLETIKELTINSLGISEELFNEAYIKNKKVLDQYRDDKVASNKILKRLTE